MVFLIIYPNKNFDEPFDGIVYSVFVGMGFATAENLTFVMQWSSSLALLRMVSAIPAHFVFAVIFFSWLIFSFLFFSIFFILYMSSRRKPG